MRKLLLGGTAAVSVLTFAFVTREEGTELRAYKDAAGIPTICSGVTGPAVSLGMVLTPAECRELDTRAIREHQRYVDSLITVPLNPCQYTALVSFTYNVGQTSLRGSTLRAKLNASDYRGAAAEFPKWNKATVNGQKVVLRGLTNRRLREQALFTNKCEV